MNFINKRLNEITNVGNDYINDIIVSESFYITDCDQYVQEGLREIGDSIKEKAKKAIDFVKSLWNKFKEWIKGMFDVVTNMLKSGKTLVEKYEDKIREGYDKKKNNISYNGYVYVFDGSMLEVSADEFLNAFNYDRFDIDNIKGELGNIKDSSIELISDSNIEEMICASITGGECKSKQELIEGIINNMRGEKPKKHKLADINIEDLIDYAAHGKEVIKVLKNIKTNADKIFKEGLKGLQSLYSELDDDDKNKKNKKSFIDYLVKTLKKFSSVISDVIKSMIKEVKNGSRLYTSLIRKILDFRTKETEVEEKETTTESIDYNYINNLRKKFNL